MKGRLCFAIVAMLLMAARVEAQENYRIVVNVNNPVTSLSRAQVSRLFLEKASWENGVAVAPVDLLTTSALRAEFTKDVLGMTLLGVQNRLRETFGANGSGMPPMVASDREVLAYVRLKAGAIGYVSRDADVQGVKVIAIGRKTETTTAIAAAAPERILTVKPVYPDLARQAGVTGTVELSVVIGAEGAVESAKVVRSIPALNAAAIAAVKQWRYRPTIVNGVPVPVATGVSVTFTP